LSSSLLKTDLKDLKLPSWLTPRRPAAVSSGGLRVKYPPLAMDIGMSRLILARLVRNEKKEWTLGAQQSVEIPPDLLDSEFFRIKIRSVESFSQFVGSMLQTEGKKRDDKISLVLPDHLARVAILKLEEMPRKRKETIELLRWQLKRSVPFKVDEAFVDFQVFSGLNGGHSVLAVLMPKAILLEQEMIFKSLGVHAGLIDLSSFSLVQLYRGIIDKEVPDGGDFMVVNATTTFFTVMIFRGGEIIFYRCKTFGFGGDEDPESAHRMINRETQASLLYYQDRLQGKELSRIYLRVVGHDLERVKLLFHDAPTAAAPELIDVRRVIDVTPAGISLGGDAAMEQLQRLAPAVGAALGREA